MVTHESRIWLRKNEPITVNKDILKIALAEANSIVEEDIVFCKNIGLNGLKIIEEIINRIQGLCILKVPRKGPEYIIQIQIIHIREIIQLENYLNIHINPK